MSANNEWTPEEDAQLIAAFRKYGCAWLRVQEEMKTKRGINALLKRWHCTLKLIPPVRHWRKEHREGTKGLKIRKKYRSTKLTTPVPRIKTKSIQKTVQVKQLVSERALLKKARKMKESKSLGKNIKIQEEQSESQEESQEQRVKKELKQQSEQDSESNSESNSDSDAESQNEDDSYESESQKGNRRTRKRQNQQIQRSKREKNEDSQDGSINEEEKNAWEAEVKGKQKWLKQWNKVDDRMLMSKIVDEGVISWKRLASIFATTQEQVRKRWQKVVFHSVRHPVVIGGFYKWTKEEDKIVMHGFKNKFDWNQTYSRSFLPRTPGSIKTRFSRLIKKHHIQVEASQSTGVVFKYAKEKQPTDIPIPKQKQTKKISQEIDERPENRLKKWDTNSKGEKITNKIDFIRSQLIKIACLKRAEQKRLNQLPSKQKENEKKPEQTQIKQVNKNLKFKEKVDLKSIFEMKYKMGPTQVQNLKQTEMIPQQRQVQPLQAEIEQQCIEKDGQIIQEEMNENQIQVSEKQQQIINEKLCDSINIGKIPSSQNPQQSERREAEQIDEEGDSQNSISE